MNNDLMNYKVMINKVCLLKLEITKEIDYFKQTDQFFFISNLSVGLDNKLKYEKYVK